MKINFPTKIISANTSDENIDIENKKIKWTFSLSEISKEPQIMKATFVNPKSNSKAPNNILIVLLVAGAIIVGLALLKNRKS